MASGALEQSALEAKDRDQLLAIAKALGVKSAGRAKKEEIIDMILEQTAPAESAAPVKPATVSSAASSAPSSSSSPSAKSSAPALGADGQPLSEWEIELAEHEGTPIAPEARRRTEQTDSHSDNREVRDNRGPREPRNDFRDNRNNGPRNYNDQDGGNRNRNRNRRRRTPGGFRNTRDDGPQGADRYELNEMQDSN